MKLKIIILIVYTTGLLDYALMIPLLGQLSLTFASAGSSLTGMVLTLSTIVSIPVILLSGWLSRRFSKKTLLIIGNLIIVTGGVACAFAGNIYVLLALRAWIGIGLGILSPLPMGLVAEMFHGEARTGMVGTLNASGELFGIGITLIAGYIAVINWRAVFGIYFWCLLAILVIIIFLPKPSAVSQNISLKAGQRKAPLGRHTWLFLIFFYGLVLLPAAVIYLNLAIFIESERIGSAATAGVASAILASGIMLIGFMYKHVYRRLRRYTLILGIFLMASGYLWLSYSFDLMTLMFSTVIFALGMGFMFPYGFVRLMDIAPADSVSKAIILANILMSLVMFAASFFAPIVISIFGNVSLRLVFQIAAGWLTLDAVIALFYGLTSEQRGLDARLHRIVTISN